MGEVVVSDLLYGSHLGLGPALLLGLASFHGDQIDPLIGRVDGFSGALAGFGKAQGRVGAEYSGPLRLMSRPVAEKPIAQPLWVFGAGGIDPKAQTGHSRVGDDEPAGCRRFAGADEAIGELGFHDATGPCPVRPVLARYSPGTQKPAARGRTGANGRDEYRDISQ